jgi:hypothetical protein
MLKKTLAILIFVILSLSAINYVMATNPLDPDDADLDPDNDELKNWEEYLNGTDPNNADSDNDGVPDGWEVYNDMDPADPTDAHEDLDYQTPSFSFNGEIDSQFAAVRHGFDVWPSDKVTQVAADLHYDNYEEYYRAFDHLAGEQVPVFYAPTDPNEADSDADNILDPDDFEPHNFANDGTSYWTGAYSDSNVYPQQPSQANTYESVPKTNTLKAMNNFQSHNSVFTDADLFTSIRF